MTKEKIATPVNLPAFVMPEKDSVMTEAKFEGICNTIAKKANEARDLIQSAGIQALVYALHYDNFDRLTMLWRAVDTNLNERSASQLRLWIEANSPAVLRKTEDKNYAEGKKFRKSGSKEANPFNLQGAYDKPWYKQEGFTQEEKAEVLLDTMSFVDRATKLIKAMETAIEKKQIEPESIDSVRSLQSKLSGVIVEFTPKAKTQNVELVKAAGKAVGF